MSRSRRTVILTAVLLALAAGQTASAHPDDAIFWTWDPPPVGFSPTNSSLYERMIKVWTMNPFGATRTGTQAADDLAYQLNPMTGTAVSRLCVNLFTFGSGNQPFTPSTPSEDWSLYGVPLWFHEDDAVSSLYPGDLGQCTLWMTNGVATAGAWMDDFIDRYKNYWHAGAPGTYPNPMRFHFDSEPRVPIDGDQELVDIFDWMLNEELYKMYVTEVLPGHGDSTLGSLWDGVSGEIDFDPLHGPSYSANHDWTNWFTGVARQTADGALDLAAYSKIRDAWAGCLSSEYDLSLRLDGQGDPPRIYHARSYVDDWRSFSWKGFGDLQALVLYPITRDYVDGGWSCTAQNAATLAHHRKSLNAAVRSFPLEDRVPIVPWLTVPCYALGEGGGIDAYIYNEATMRRLLALNRAKGVTEMIIWTSTPATSSAWNAFDKVKNDAFGADIDNIVVGTGTGPGSPTDELTYSNADPMLVETDDIAPGVSIAEIEVEYTSTFNSPSAATKLEVNTELWYGDCSECGQGTSITVFVAIWDYVHSQWDDLDNFPLTGVSASYPTIHLSADESASDHVDTNGDVKISVTVSSQEHLTVRFDLVQVVKVESDGCTSCEPE